MTNLDLATLYSSNSYTHKYIFPVRHGSSLFAVAVQLSADALAMLTTLERSSEKNGSKPVLKYRWNSSKEQWLSDNALWVKPITDIDILETMVANSVEIFGSRQNRGNVWEYLVIKALNAIGNDKANLDYTQGGDCECDGIAYQIKYNKSSFAYKG